MKIIDNKGKIFGLINYLDLMVLLVVVLLVGKFYILDNNENSKEFLQSQASREMLLTYNVSGIKDISIKSVKEGDIFRDVETKSTLGEVVKVEVTDHLMQTTDKDGNVIHSKVPGRYDMRIVLKCGANITDRDIKISKVEIQIGRSMFIESRMIRFQSVIEGIEF
ncbi:DUF4330 domain-containing protein [Wukongibacter baidiensis]|uniref:DUF4330 domain-containing protein n=1 Tax=Wukongibacter baidiensis TaxID=1723361 RepID=UPI003D7FA337